MARSGASIMMFRPEAFAAAALPAASPSPADLADWTAHFAAAAACLDRSALDRLEAALPPPDDPSTGRLRFLPLWSLWWTDGPLAACARVHELEDLRVDWSPHEGDAIRYLQALNAQVHGRRGPMAPVPQAGPGNATAVLPLDKLGALPVLVGRCQGVEGRFVLDTGAPGCLVTRAFAERAGLVAASAARGTFDGSGQALALHPAIAAELSFEGALPLSDVLMDVADFEAQLPFDGLVSPQTIWRGCDLYLDGPAATLRLGPPGSQGAHLPYEATLTWCEGQPFVQAQTAEGSLMLLLDTGAGGHLVMDDVAPGVGLSVRPSDPAVLSPTAAGHAVIHPGGMLALRIGNAPEASLRFGVKRRGPALPQCFPSPLQGYLGMPWLDGREVCLLADRRSLRFSGPLGGRS
jgi:hypothetical protein